MKAKGKTTIISGAGSGIGRALAIEFGRNGAKVVCCSRRKDRLDETVAVITEQGGQAIAIATDVTEQSQVRKMVEMTNEEFGAIDIVFNNAGSFQSSGGVYEIDPAVWWNDVTVNLYGPLLVIREILPQMISRDTGIIINMDGGRPPGGTGYACSKAGLMELTRVLAQELEMIKSSVMVFSADPGLVRTDMTELQVNSAAGRKWIPLTKELFDAGRLRKPEEIAEATMRMIEVATVAARGRAYGPDTDFSDWL